MRDSVKAELARAEKALSEADSASTDYLRGYRAALAYVDGLLPGPAGDKSDQAVSHILRQIATDPEFCR